MGEVSDWRRAARLTARWAGAWLLLLSCLTRPYEADLAGLATWLGTNVMFVGLLAPITGCGLTRWGPPQGRDVLRAVLFVALAASIALLLSLMPWEQANPSSTLASIAHASRQAIEKSWNYGGMVPASLTATIEGLRFGRWGVLVGGLFFGAIGVGWGTSEWANGWRGLLLALLLGLPAAAGRTINFIVHAPYPPGQIPMVHYDVDQFGRLLMLLCGLAIFVWGARRRAELNQPPPAMLS